MSALYPHVAPILREKLIRACGQAASARTQKGRQAGYQEAYAFGTALDALRRSEDGQEAAAVAGVFQPWAIPTSYWSATAEFLKDNADRILGEGWMDARNEQRPA